MFKKSVILFRASDLPSDFVNDLKCFFTIQCVPVLSFDYESFESNLRQIDFSESTAVIFPSQRAVIAIHRLSINLSNSPIFVVGDSTATSCLELLQKRPELVGKFGAKELCNDLISSKRFSKVIYLCGDNQATLPYEDFKQANIEVQEVCCYGVRDVSQEELMKSLENSQVPDFCVFFSPSGVRCVTEKINWDWGKPMLLAIGSTTAKALNDTLGRCDGVPEEFNLNGIKDLLMKYLEMFSALGIQK